MEIPEGWQRLPLGDLFEFKNGYNTDKSAYGSGTPFVNVMEVFSTDKLVVEDIAGTVTASQEHLELFSVVYGDVLFNRTSETPEDIAMATTYMADDKAIFGGFVIRGRQITKSLLAEYCVYCFQSSSIRKAMISRGQGAIRSNIGQKDLNKVALLFPPLPEQRRIAEILGTWDRAIAVTEALIAQSEAQKKALMQQLLTGKRRLPEFEGEWKEVRLGDVAELSSGNAFKSADILETGRCRLIRMNDLKSGILKNNEPRFVADHAVSGLERFKLFKGEFVFGMTGSLANYAWIESDASDDLYLNQRVGRLAAKDNNSNKFLQYLYLSTPFQNSILRMAAGAAQLNISLRDLRNFKVIVPSLSEQRAIANLIEIAANETALFQAKLQTLKTEKAALMQQLLTGKRRVKLNEVAA